MNPQPRVRIRTLVGRRPRRIDLLVIPTPSDRRAPLPALLQPWDRAAKGFISTRLRTAQLEDEAGTMDAGFCEGGTFERLAIVSLGPAERCDTEAIRRAAAAAIRFADKTSARSVLFAVDPLRNGDDVARIAAAAEGLWLGDYRFEHFKSSTKPRPRIDAHLASSRALPRGLAAELAALRAIARAVYLARDVAHQPANQINPLTLAALARTVARRTGLRCRILDEKQMRARRMGGILAVGAGSATPPRLIILEHRTAAKTSPIVLVGKAITFDTGGYSLKPRDNIVGMKYDKCGGVAVLACLQAVAELGLKRPVVGVIAAAENMINERAYRPDDIIRTMSGKTVEIVSTDAEGRMVLCDALTYAQRTYRPAAVIDLATLTGGATIALGHEAAALFATHDDLADALVRAGQATFERLWRLPLWPEYRKLMKGTDADLVNSAGRPAHCIQGAVFLHEFVEPQTRWAHLDIASVADISEERPYCPKGATGFGVRLLCEFLRGSR